MRILQHNHRRGNALVITMLMVVAVIGLLSLASERMLANKVQSDITSDRHRAQAAAETLAAMIEAKLFELAAENTARLKEDLDTGTNTNFWWGRRGFTYANSAATTGLYLNGCMLRWRVEPVKIMARTIAETGNSTGTFTVNSENDLAAQQSRKNQAGPGLFPIDPGYFHFRIVTEAFALKNRADTTVLPWATEGTHTAVVQAQRVLQLKDVNLFRYVIFYAAVGQTGDIEFHPGPDLHIQGAIHSNGAIFLGGGSGSYLDGRYHDAASNGGNITIGTEEKPVNVTGVDGIFRMRKAGNHHMARMRNDATLRDPYQVPLLDGESAGGVRMSGDDNLNGGLATSTKIVINGVPLNYGNDSRNGLTNGLTGQDELRHNDLVTDARNRDARVVRGISNVPSFSGYPLENGREIGAGVVLRQFGSDYTTLEQDEARYPGQRPIPVAGNPPATDMPMFLFPQPNGAIVRDIWPYQPTPAENQCDLPPISGLAIAIGPGLRRSTWNLASSPNRLFTYLPELPPASAPTATTPPHQALNDYFRWSIFGRRPTDSLSGLTIRERGMQNEQWLIDATVPAADGSGGVVWPTGVIDHKQAPILADYLNATPPQTAGDWVRAYAWWMKSNYAVYLGKRNGFPVDITHQFFEFQLGSAIASGSLADVIVHEDIVRNVRERAWETANGYTPSDANLLTINIGKVMEFLRTTPLNTLPPHTGTANANAVFNGLMYIHRTLRFDRMTVVGSYINGTVPFAHPLKTNGYHPLNSSVPIGFARYPIVGMVGSAPSTTVELGTIGSWTVYPSTRAVRLANAATINYGGVQPKSDNRLAGLTVVTPNPCYLWGNYNTTVAPDARGVDQVTPCAVFADSMTALSNAWNDADAGLNNRPAATSTTYVTSFVINNMPTDAANLSDEGSGGVHNVVRFLENWGRQDFFFKGSLVVLNRMRYSRSTIGAGVFYSPPNRHYDFNSDLLTGPGQPPFSLKGTVPTRVVSTVNILNN
jgi:Tfp pilus assembly protein PilX